MFVGVATPCTAISTMKVGMQSVEPRVSLLSFQLQPHGRYVREFRSKPLGNIIAMVVPLRERETLNYTKISNRLIPRLGMRLESET